MTNRANAVAVEQPATTVTPVHQRIVDHFLPHIDRDAELLRLLLIPAGSLVIAGILALALSRIAEAPTLEPSDSSYQADMESRAEMSGIGHLGPAFTR